MLCRIPNCRSPIDRGGLCTQHHAEQLIRHLEETDRLIEEIRTAGPECQAPGCTELRTPQSLLCLTHQETTKAQLLAQLRAEMNRPRLEP